MDNIQLHAKSGIRCEERRHSYYLSKSDLGQGQLNQSWLLLPQSSTQHPGHCDKSTKQWNSLQIDMQRSRDRKRSFSDINIKLIFACLISSVKLLCLVWLFTTPLTAACQDSLFITNSQSLLKLMSIELLIPSNHFILCHPLLIRLQSCPASWSFPMSQFFASGGQSIETSASASVLPMNIQDWFPLGLTGLISLQYQGFSRVFSNTTVQKHQFFGAQLPLYSAHLILKC